ncbi:MAG: hypothetical protein EOP48_28425, partial [Sphingobacteriales bacterium]
MYNFGLAYFSVTVVNGTRLSVFKTMIKSSIFNGISSLCDYIVQQKRVCIDGYVGVYWGFLKNAISNEIISRGLSLNVCLASDFMKSEEDINLLTSPFIGAPGSVWGKNADLSITDYFDNSTLKQLQVDESVDVNITIGPGAALAGWSAALIYIDLPKNELQHRMSAGSIFNLGITAELDQTEMYKRFYFVDWVILNKHKKDILNRVDVFCDAQWEHDVNWAYGQDIRKGLERISTSVFRPRPWFAPGAWGGQWMKRHMPQLEQSEVNYAWSFEIIAPENGIVFQSSGLLLEVSFDMLMFHSGDNILGHHATKFGYEFPIRFDFLDTFDGGNLSIQCHPSLDYIQSEFGERITQDETYYILDCKENASVYLGFQEGIDPDKFRKD